MAATGTRSSRRRPVTAGRTTFTAPEPTRTPSEGRRDVLRVAVDEHVNLFADGGAEFFGELPEEAGTAGEERYAAQQLGRQAEVGEGSAAHAGTVEGEG